MARNRNFPMDDQTHRQLKAYAAIQGVTIGNAIKLLLDKTEKIQYSCDSQHNDDTKGENKL